MMTTGRSRFPFTASQWQELEQQALIFKYMVSGMPIPPDLLLTIKRSLDSSLSSKFIVHQTQHIGWNCFQMGFGRKIDPEPGRCRRTDGKKWRCSKEAYPDSKYCERHMHRGRSRSRKPVEVLTASTPTPLRVSKSSSTPSVPPTAIPISSITKSPAAFTLSNPTNSHSFSSNSSAAHNYNSTTTCHATPLHSSFLYPHTPSSRPPGIGPSSHENTAHFLLQSGHSSRTDRGYSGSSYGQGIMKEEGGVDEHAFFSEPSVSIRSLSGSSSVDDSWQLTPLTMGSNSLAHVKPQRASSGVQTAAYSSFHLQGLNDSDTKQHHKQDQHCHELAERDNEPQKVMHHFFDEWPPPKNKDLWLDSNDRLSNHGTTQLSISIPNSSYLDFFLTRNDKGASCQ